MADERTITTVFQADISQFSASTQALNRYIKTVNSEFANATAGMGRWSDNTDGLNAKIRQLNGVLVAEEKKLQSLQDRYNSLTDEQKKNTKEGQELAIAINNQSAVVKKTKNDIEHYTASLKELEDAGVNTKDELEKLNKEIDNTSNKGGGFGSVAKGIGKGIAGIATACVGAVASLLSLGESTRELRKQLGQLETAFTSAGHNAETAEKTFEKLYGVLGDEGKATEASMHLAQFAENEQELEELTKSLTGAYAMFGDSLPIENIAEGASTTLTLGQANAGMVDAIEFAGGSVEDFNKKLQSLTTEEEKRAFILETLNGLYGEAGEQYQEVNKDIIEAQEAQMGLNNALAKLGEIAEPIMTTLKLLLTDILESLTPFIGLIGEGLMGAFNGSAEAGQMFAEGITGILNSLVEKATELLPTLIDMILDLLPLLISTILNMLPQLISTIANLITQIILALADLLPSVVDEILKALPAIVQGIIDALPQLINAIFVLLNAIVKALPTIIDTLLGSLDQIIEAIINGLIIAIPQIVQGAVKLFLAIIDAIPKIVSALQKNIPTIIKTIVQGLIKAIPEIFNAGVQLIEGLWEGIKSMGGWLYNQISGFFDGVVDGIKDFFGIHSPSTLFRDEIGKNLALGIGEGFEGELGSVAKTMKRSLNDLTPTLAMAGANIEVNNNSSILHELASLMKESKGTSQTNNTFNYTFEKMETTKHALHKAQLETKRLLGRK